MSNPIEALPIVKERATVKVGRDYPGAWEMYLEARELWHEEYEAWRALQSLGLSNAADCAWQRRTAAQDLTLILLAAT